ncbi:hypothetical protein [Stenotrophomonas nematodicola]|uniref:HIRAN domain-containing protein n=1 Tax=Stenotrophomonas nematodicola TaxID=2656746 RepID=A0ABW7CX37_9GAMM
MSDTFEWIHFPEGQARFSGIRRGWDEQGRHTFSIKLDGNEYFGEIKRLFSADDDKYGIVIDAFGYELGETVGMPGLAARRTFTTGEAAATEALVIKLVQAGSRLIDPPSIFLPKDIADFTGEIQFKQGWILVGIDIAGDR